jgi:hypothetical protein
MQTSTTRTVLATVPAMPPPPYKALRKPRKRKQKTWVN